MAVNLHTTHYRFGSNELAESTHGWHAALDANPAQGVIAVDTTFLLRFTVQETGGTAAGNVDQQLQCRKNLGAWQDITTTSSIVKAVTTTVFASGADLTKRLTGTGTFESSGDGGTHDGLSGGPQNDIAASGNSETECALQIVGIDVNHNDVLTFRLTSPDFPITNDIVPTLTMQKATPVKVITGTASMTTARQTPALVASDNKNVSPGILAATTALFAPTVAIGGGVEVTPGVASLTTSNFTSTVATSDNKNVTPGTLSVVITRLVAIVQTPINVIPGVLSAVVTFFAAVVSVSGLGGSVHGGGVGQGGRG